MKSVLVIGGFDPTTDAGIGRDIRILEKFGIKAYAIVTCVTAQNEYEFLDKLDLPTSLLEKQLSAITGDYEFVKISVVGNEKNAKFLAEKLSDKEIILDPVMESSTGAKLYEGNVETLKPLIKNCYTITPNIQEAKLLTGENFLERMLIKLKALGAKNVVLKGGHLRQPVDYLYTEDERIIALPSDKFKVKLHGSGCIFSSVLTAELAKGKCIEKAVKNAREEIYRHINPYFLELERFIKRINTKGFYKLVPEIGSNVAYLTEYGTLAIDGRIRKGKEGLIFGKIAMNASDHLARLLREINKKDNKIKCCINIRYSKEVIEKLRKELNCIKIEREKLPKRKTMNWIARSIEKVPDVIYDEGDIGKEPMIRILAKTLDELYEKLAILL